MDPNIKTEEFDVPKNKYGIIIGEKGSNLLALEETFSVSINVPKKGDENQYVSISGKIQDIKATRNQMDQLIQKGFCAVTHPGIIDSHVVIAEDQKAQLIGKGGVNIKKLQEATNCKINLPKRNDTTNAVTIIGSKADVDRCRVLVYQLATTGFCEVTHPGLRKKDIPFPFDKVSLIIGHNGNTIKSIQGSTKTKINTPKQLGMPLSIIGRPEDIFAAEKQIQNILNPPVITLQDLANQKDNKWAKAFQYGWDYDSIVIKN